MTLKLAIWRVRNAVKVTLGAGVGYVAIALVRITRPLNPDRVSNLSGTLLRKVGPLLREHRTARDNLKAAFPEKTEHEIDGILAGAWNNLGRVAGEFAYLNRLWDFNPDTGSGSRIEIPPETAERLARLRDDGAPALIFGAHLGNWELAAIAAAEYGIESAVLYRKPNITQIDTLIRGLRTAKMGELVAANFKTPARLVALLKSGVHVGMLIDQYHNRGVDITFFGRRTRASPLLAWLASKVDCPIHGMRTIRLPENRFRLELTEQIAPVRNAVGEVDVVATTQRFNDVVEGWVREHPEQWLWMHRRWRPNDKPWTPKDRSLANGPS